MAITIPIVTEFADKGLKSAEAAFATFKGKVAEAEGGIGKMKAGFGVATDYMKANAATFATVAGGAIAGFAKSAIGDFSDLALSVDKFRDATGLTLDEASRWTEVADDIGVDAGIIETAINKMNKEAAKGEDYFNKLGVEMVKHKDGTYDPEGTFLKVIDALKNMKDPADKAKVATQLLGKGWTDMADLINEGSDKLKESLDSVSGKKLIDEEDVRRAKDLRDETDKLKDSWDNLKLSVGEALVPMTTDLMDFVTSPSWGEFFSGIGSAAGLTGEHGLIHNMAELIGVADDAQKKYGQLGDFIKRHVKTIADAALQFSGLSTKIGDVDADTNGLIDTWDEMLGRLDDRQAFNDVKNSLDDVYAAVGRALEEKTPEAARAAQDAIGNLYGDVADYITLLGDIPADKQTKILALLDQGKYDEVLRLLDQLTRERTVKINTVQGTTVRPGDTPSESRSRGVNVVGPDGRSYYIPPGLDFSGFGKTTTKAVDLTSGGGSGNRPTVMVNVQGSVTSEKDLVETIRRGLVNAQRNGAQLVYSNT